MLRKPARVIEKIRRSARMDMTVGSAKDNSKKVPGWNIICSRDFICFPEEFRVMEVVL